MKGSAHDFVHLHVRSGFSYGYGTATPEEIVEEAAATGMRALALTDRDGLYGIPRLLEAAREAGVSPVIGAEVGIESGGHLVLLAEGLEGYRSLCRLITAYRRSSEDRRRPVCPLGTLLEHAEGLVCLTGAVPFGLIPRLLLAGRCREAGGMARLLRETFEGRLYAELTDDGTAGSRRRCARVAAFAREENLPVLATNEVAYLRPGDHRLHEVLVAASNLSSLPGPEYRPTDQLYLRPPAEMLQIFNNHPEAVANAAAVAERCAGAVDLSGKTHMPAARVPGGSSARGALRAMAFAGARKLYGKGDGDPTLGEVAARLRRELGCIEKLGFAPYFLVAREARGIARSRGIPVTGRGSAANSLVSYCLGLTQPEPFGNGLLFERFMHEDRLDPPDIDLDFCSKRRDEVRFEMVRRHKGPGAAEAATVQTMSLRGAVRVAARALGHPPPEVDSLSRHVPTRFRDRDRVYAGLDGWREVLREPAMRGHPLQDTGRYHLLLGLSAGLAGRIREAGTHSGGMVFGSAEHHLSELVPLEPSGTEGLPRCQYDKDDLERVGIPKLDLLGLRMHTALHEAGVLATRRTGQKVDPYDPPPGDVDTYALIRTGNNAGMFQLESPGQMNLSRRLKPGKFPDLVAQISLFRPGPVRGDLVTPFIQRKNGEVRAEKVLPQLREALRRTYGVLVYQEQVLAVANAVAGFSFAEGDKLRRAMTRNRGPDAMRGLRDEFLRRAVNNGVPMARADEVFSWMEGFSVYGFSAAHAASFAELSYASAYMRTHYPAAFFCALLNSQPMGFYSPRLLLNEARRIGLGILTPDVNISGEDFTVEDGPTGPALRVGLRYCKGLSGKAISSIKAERRERPFVSVADLYGRTSVEKDSLANLVRGGFLDGLAADDNRARLLDEAATLPRKRRRGGQPEIPLQHPASWWALREGRAVEHLPLADTAKERMEWEVLSLNVQRHPLQPYREALGDLGVRSSREILTLPHGTRARAAGLIECLQSPPTKSGHRVYFLLIEDEWGLLQATLFRSAYRRCGDLLHREGAFLLEGRVEQTRSRGFAFLVERAKSLQKALAGVKVPAPRAASAPGAFLRAARRGRKAG